MLLPFIETYYLDYAGFGVLVWELFTHGLEPYPDMDNSQVWHLVRTGYHMESPEDCPPRVYDLMRHCWEHEPENRPTFSEALTTLNSISDINEGKLFMLYSHEVLGHY